MRVAGALIETRAVLVAGLAGLVAAAGAYVLGRTRTGRALRAVTDDRAAALLVGVPVARLTTIAFAVAGALAALAALAATAGGPVDATSGELLGARAVAIAFAVGFAGPGRAYVAGLAFGVLEEAVSALDPGPAWLASSATVLPLLGCLAVGLARGRSR
jgi:branched-chain amino acid transport system permease protein